MIEKDLFFANAHTAKSRIKQHIPATVLEPQVDNVILVDFNQKRRLR